MRGPTFVVQLQYCKWLGGLNVRVEITIVSVAVDGVGSSKKGH